MEAMVKKKDQINSMESLIIRCFMLALVAFLKSSREAIRIKAEFFLLVTINSLKLAYIPRMQV